MNEVLWTIGFVFLLFSAYGAFLNAGIPLRWLLHKKQGSMVPLAAGFIGVLGLLALPVHSIKPFWWMPLIWDLGSAYLLTSTSIYFVVEVIRKAQLSK